MAGFPATERTPVFTRAPRELKKTENPDTLRFPAPSIHKTKDPRPRMAKSTAQDPPPSLPLPMGPLARTPRVRGPGCTVSQITQVQAGFSPVQGHQPPSSYHPRTLTRRERSDELANVKRTVKPHAGQVRPRLPGNSSPACIRAPIPIPTTILGVQEAGFIVTKPR